MSDTTIVNFEQVNDMLDNDPEYLKEFCEAAIISFSTYRQEYQEHMTGRDIENLRRAGHRIKPVAQMLGVEQVVDEYENGKQILTKAKSDKQLKASVEKVDALCNQILREFRNKIEA